MLAIFCRALCGGVTGNFIPVERGVHSVPWAFLWVQPQPLNMKETTTVMKYQVSFSGFAFFMMDLLLACPTQGNT